jgi:pyrroline-5-carboxylate reductase
MIDTKQDIKKVRVSVIGAGALGGAVARGLAKAGCGVLASDAHPDRCARSDGMELTSDNLRAAAEGEVVMFAVKPHLTLGVVEECAPFLQGKLCISLAAVVTLALLERAAPEARWARAMTSICAAIHCAFTGISRSNASTAADAAWMKEAFALLGEVEEVDEGLLNTLTSMTGAGPAFFASLAEAAAMGGIQAGLPKELAYRSAMSALLGAARLAAETDKHPAALRDDICTPGGMTIEGVYELERAGARAAMMRAVVLTAEKGKALTEKMLAPLKP